jgi:hypothetical protein
MAPYFTTEGTDATEVEIKGWLGLNVVLPLCALCVLCGESLR